MSFCKGITQSGSNADTLLTDAYIKGIQNVPWQQAFEAILKVLPHPPIFPQYNFFPSWQMADIFRTQKSNHLIGA
jgi:Glycosyl hydrolase family 92